jgi:L-glyceraldehyde reductase
VADGIKEAGIPREEITLVSKLWNNSHRPENVEADLDTSLSQLRTEYLDVYLIHWPVAFKAGKELAPTNEDGTKAIDTEAPGVSATWKEMVRISKETKKVKAVGVSNFSVEMLEKIIKATGVVPTMNQIECHPSLIQPELFKYCESPTSRDKELADDQARRRTSSSLPTRPSETTLPVNHESSTHQQSRESPKKSTRPQRRS